MMDVDAQSAPAIPISNASSILSNTSSYTSKRNGGNAEENSKDEPPVAPTSATVTATRHLEYYFSDGNCVIRVEDTLFKVHRIMFTREDSAFKTMFTLPQDGSMPVEGVDDGNPILLPGDKAEAFANLLWALYSMPDELVKRSEDVGYTPKIFDVALLANKYAFKGLEKWAAKSLIKTMNKGHSKLSISVRDKLYPEILRFAVDNDYVKLEKVLTDYFLHMMKVSWKRTVDVINIAHELELDNLLGRAYFHLLSKPKYEWDMDLGDGVSLTAEHRIRLLSGFHSLVTTWEEIRSDLPPAFTHCQSCIDASDGTCKRGVLLFWTGILKNEGVLGKEPYDVVGRLETIISTLGIYSDPHLRPGCKSHLKETLQGLIARTESEYHISFYSDDT